MSKQLQHRLDSLKSERSKALNVQASMVLAGKQDTPEFRAIQANIDDLNSDIESIQQLMGMSSYQALVDKQEAEQEQRVAQQLTSSVVSAVKEAIPQSSAVTVIKSEDRAALVSAYRSFLATGKIEARDVSQTGSGISLVPAGFDTTYKQALKLVSPLAATVQSIEASKITKVFSVADTASDQKLLAEGSNVGASADPLFSSYMPPFTDSGISAVKVAWQLLNDSAFSMESFIQTVTKGRVARFYDSAVLRGTDPAGTVLPNSVAGGLLGAVTSGVVQAGGAGSLATGWKYTDAVALVNSISDVAYNEDAAFLVSPKMRQFILSNFVSTTGEPLYKFDENGQLMLLGRPVWTSAYFPSYGASTVQALYGRFDLSYQYQYFNRLYSNVPRPELMESQFALETRFAGTPTQIAPKALVALTTSAS